MQSVPQTLATPFHLTRDEVWTGFKQLVPLSFFIIIRQTRVSTLGFSTRLKEASGKNLWAIP